MGDDTVVIVPPDNSQAVQSPPPVDDTRDDILIQFGEIRAKAEELHGRIENIEQTLSTLSGGLEEVRSAIAGFTGIFAEIGHTHSEYALSEHQHITDPVTEQTVATVEPGGADVEPESQHFWFRRIGA